MLHTQTPQLTDELKDKVSKHQDEEESLPTQMAREPLKEASISEKKALKKEDKNLSGKEHVSSSV